MVIVLKLKKGEDPDGTSAIYRITQDGKIVLPTVLGDKDPLNKYYAYGITQDGKIVSPTVLGDKDPLNKYYAYGLRNSFGLDFDPVTGNLWDTENGPNFGDEINLVKPGFNSGWGKVQGIWEPCPSKPSEIGEDASPNPEGLVSVNGKGKYSPPEFTWNDTVGVTSLKFINSEKLGKEYENDLLVGDFHNGYLYHFDLNKKRDQLLLEGSLKDKVADNMKELKNAIFGRGFGGITDMQIGPDGYLYILSLQEGGSNCLTPYYNSWCIKYNSPIDGTIYKIIPQN
jgi:glucose/arabinose dehydrogenase